MYIVKCTLQKVKVVIHKIRIVKQSRVPGIRVTAVDRIIGLQLSAAKPCSQVVRARYSLLQGPISQISEIV